MIKKFVITDDGFDWEPIAGLDESIRFDLDGVQIDLKIDLDAKALVIMANGNFKRMLIEPRASNSIAVTTHD